MSADVLLDEKAETIDVIDDLVIPDVAIPCEAKPCGDLAEWLVRMTCERGHRTTTHLCDQHEQAAHHGFRPGWHVHVSCGAPARTLRSERLKP